MKSKYKISFAQVLAILVICFAMVVPSFLGLSQFASAETANSEQTDTSSQSGYFYNQLPDMAKKFYVAIDSLEDGGQLKTGVGQYDLVENGVLTTAEIVKYTKGDETILKMFGAGRDAYRLDNPDVFYIDFDKLSISIGKTADGYTAYLGTGRADNYYITDGFANASEIDNALSQYQTALNTIVSGIDKTATIKEQVVAVNEAISNATTYSYGYSVDGNAIEGVTPYIRTPYGALVNGKAVCEGYARAFKAVCDKLDIPCVLVNGYLLSEDMTSYEPHMWNYVQIDDEWYGVDVTLNDSDGYHSSENQYLLLDKEAMRVDHAPDGVISQSNFDFSYPTLTSEEESFVIKEPTFTETSMTVEVSYQNMNARDMEAQGLYLVYIETDGTKTGGIWYAVNQMMDIIVYTPHKQSEHSTSLTTNPSIDYIRIGVVNIAPNSTNEYTKGYSYDNIPAENFVELSDWIFNVSSTTYSRPPYVSSLSPSNATILDVVKTYNIEVVYDEELELLEGESEPKINVTSSSEQDISDYVEITNIVWNENDPCKITFTFKASQLYQHNYMIYYFTPANLVKRDEDKVIFPNTFGYVFERAKIVCNKILSDGRLYMSVYGQPSLLDNSDLSISGWEYGDGQKAYENQRSQLALVVTKPSSADSDEMIDSVVDSTEGITSGDVLASATYELNLDLCGCVTTIPNGSYMKLAFGFPEGYGPEDEGVTFKVYHFVRGNDGKIDPSKTTEIDCVVTQYGLVVVVDSFSPFAVVALPSSKVQSSEKAIYTRVVGENGAIKVKVDETTFEGNNLNKVAENGSITYALQPAEGYQVDFVLVNGKQIEVSENSFTLTYEEPSANNTIDVGFVAESVAQFERENGITNLQSTFIANQDLTEKGDTPSPAVGGNNILTTIVVVVVIIALLVIMLYVSKRKARL